MFLTAPATVPAKPPVLAQVTSVSQLSDVQPTDWAFQALRSLIERYGCIAGYPDSTYRGNRALTRYEFAAGLNACLDQILGLIGDGDTLDPENMATLRRLQEEFADELATLRGRVDTLEARISELEAHQFSTTTKLQGEAIFNLAVAAGNDGGDEIVFQDRVRLELHSSFTGRDRLTTRLQVGNSDPFRLSGVNDGIDFGNSVEGVLATQVFGDSGNSVRIDTLAYTLPIGDRFDLTLGANGTRFADFVPTLNPYFDDGDGGNGALSAFGQYNPIYRLGGGAGIGLNFKPSDHWQFSTGYLAANAEDPTSGNGLFNGDIAILTQATYTPSDTLGMALTYNYGYFSAGNFAFNNGGGNFDDTDFGFTGTRMVNGIGTTNAINSHAIGLQLAWELTPDVHLSAWGGYTGIHLDLDDLDGDIWNGAIALAFPDLGRNGNLGGLILGLQPTLTDLEDSNAFFDDDPAWHLEAFYKLRIDDSISLTPGLIWLPNPNQDSSNDDVVIGTIRTTFAF
jgi:Carbohydrate-selective porin, OprB family/S-layer homology domain